MLGRIHTYQDFLDTYFLAREAGFQNINVDLMSGIPFQTLGGWEDTIKKSCRTCAGTYLGIQSDYRRRNTIL